MFIIYKIKCSVKSFANDWRRKASGCQASVYFSTKSKITSHPLLKCFFLFPEIKAESRVPSYEVYKQYILQINSRNLANPPPDFCIPAFCRNINYLLLISFQTGYERKPPPTPEHQGLPVGGYEEKRKKLQEERSKEYNALIAKVRCDL